MSKRSLFFLYSFIDSIVNLLFSSQDIRVKDSRLIYDYHKLSYNVILCHIYYNAAWRSPEYVKSDEWMSTNMEINHRTWISQKIQKRKVLEEPVPL